MDLEFVRKHINIALIVGRNYKQYIIKTWCDNHVFYFYNYIFAKKQLMYTTVLFGSILHDEIYEANNVIVIDNTTQSSTIYNYQNFDINITLYINMDINFIDFLKKFEYKKLDNVVINYYDSQMSTRLYGTIVANVSYNNDYNKVVVNLMADFIEKSKLSISEIRLKKLRDITD